MHWVGGASTIQFETRGAFFKSTILTGCEYLFFVNCCIMLSMTTDYENMNPGPRGRKVPHYYGDIVRKYLLFAGSMLLLAVLIDRELLSFYLFIGIFGVLVFTVLAALMSPRVTSAIFTNAIVSALMFLIFEYFAISAYLKSQTFLDLIFAIRQAIAVAFLVALYFSTKTLRGMISED